MKILAGAALAAALAFGGAAGSAQAQSAERVYDNGPVWTVGYVETKPGMFDDYMAYLNGPYKVLQEAAKKRGDILAYHVLAVDSPREHEPDVILLIEFKNMAVFDRSLAELDKDTNAAFGSNTKSNQSAIKREDIRILHGGVTARELVFIK
jgi:hypothetical protein